MAALRARSALSSLRRLPGLFTRKSSSAPAVRKNVVYNPKPGTVIPENEFMRNYRHQREHGEGRPWCAAFGLQPHAVVAAVQNWAWQWVCFAAGGIMQMWYVFYFGFVPAILISGYKTYVYEREHIAHLKEHPKKWVAYPYIMMEEVCYAGNRSPFVLGWDRLQEYMYNVWLIGSVHKNLQGTSNRTLCWLRSKQTKERVTGSTRILKGHDWVSGSVSSLNPTPVLVLVFARVEWWLGRWFLQRRVHNVPKLFSFSLVFESRISPLWKPKVNSHSCDENWLVHVFLLLMVHRKLSIPESFIKHCLWSGSWCSVPFSQTCMLMYWKICLQSLSIVKCLSMK